MFYSDSAQQELSFAAKFMSIRPLLTIFLSHVARLITIGTIAPRTSCAAGPTAWGNDFLAIFGEHFLKSETLDFVLFFVFTVFKL